MLILNLKHTVPYNNSHGRYQQIKLWKLREFYCSYLNLKDFFFFSKSKIEIFNLIYIRKSNSYPIKRRSQLGEWDTTGQMPNEYLKC